MVIRHPVEMSKRQLGGMRLQLGKAMNAGFHQNENASDGECTVTL